MKKTNIYYTYPNTSSISQRGGLKTRYLKLNEINKKLNAPVFQIIEVPADFIKNINEERRTGLSVASFLDENSVPKLYSKDLISDNVNYILHTEPVFNRKGINENITSKLHWYSSSWFDEFVKHVFSIIDFFQVLPYAIEIHPGQSERKKNNIEAFLAAIEKLHNIYLDTYDKELLLFIENRTSQYIQNGTNIKQFWNYFSNKYPELTDKTGIVLDIQQLYTATKNRNKNFQTEFSKIPPDSLIGAHIHERHKKPSCKYIPIEIWDYVAENLDWREGVFHILPEVHPHSHVVPTYEFCMNYLNLGGN